MTDVIDAGDSELPMAGRSRKGDPLALQWTGLLEEDKSLDAFFRLNRAEDWSTFTDALRDLAAPAVNFLYADTEGNIGYHAAGKIPVRCGGDGSLPAEGWSGRNEWSGYLPFDELPHAYNPNSQYIISTNNAPPPPDYPWLLSKDWVEPYRAHRIKQVLEEKRLLDVMDHMLLQGDILSVHARETLPQLLALLPDADPELQPAHDLLRQWDYMAAGNGPQAAIFTAWWRKLPEVILENEMEAKVLNAYKGWSSFVNRFVMEVMTGRSPAQDSPGRLAQRSLQLALSDLRARLGPRMNSWRWDRLHFAVLPHYPFHSVPWLRPLFSRRVPREGDWSSVNFSPSSVTGPFTQRNIPSYRQVVDLSDLDHGWFIQAGGQSGHFLSPHYADFLKDWNNVRYRKMRFSPQAVKEDARATLLFDPAR
jgi:penicillin amidase